MTARASSPTTWPRPPGASSPTGGTGKSSAAAAAGVRVIVHPTAGLLRLAYETLALPDVDEQRLIVYLAVDAATSASLDRLSGRHPGGLHAVSAS